MLTINRSLLVLAILLVIIACDSSNQQPSVDAGEDFSVNEQVQASLFGQADDPDGSIMRYKWSQTSGVSVSIIDSSSPMASFEAPVTTEPLTLIFELEVTDNDNATASDTVSVLIEPVNAMPNTVEILDQIVTEGSLATLNIEATDSDGSIDSYNWIQISGPIVTLSDASASSLTFTAPLVEQNEFLVFEVNVTDNENAMTLQTATVEVIDVLNLFATGKLNDTGYLRCGDYAFDSGSGDHGNDEDCTASIDPQGDLIPAGQDGHYGRDITDGQVEPMDEVLGSSFTKIDSNGNPLSLEVLEWLCVLDNTTGLLWEVKTTTGLRDNNNTYSWYSLDETLNGGDAGIANGGNCTNSECDTMSYAEAVNTNQLRSEERRVGKEC